MVEKQIMNSTPTTIPWERRWQNQDDPESNFPCSGFRREDLVSRGHVIHAEGISLEKLQSPFALLFGSAGSGKSVSLRSFAKMHLETMAGGLMVFDLKDATVQEIETSVLAALQSNLDPIVVLIDSLDEAMLTGNGRTCRELGRAIATFPSGRVTIRVAGRPHPFNKELLDRIDQAWGSGQVTVHRLLPLSQSDVALAAEVFAVDPDAFLRAVHEKHVPELAAEPLTLIALLKSFQAGSALPESRTELYEQMIVRLAEEVDESRSTLAGAAPTMSLGSRSEVAENIAAALSFGGSAVIHLGRASVTPPERIHIDTLAGAPTGPDLREQTLDEIREVLTTGLFRSTGIDGVCFAHLSFQEFLAAKWLKRQSFGWPDLNSLLWDPDDEGRLYPHFMPEASWLAALDPTVVDNLISADPVAAIQADTAGWSDEQRAHALASVLNGIATSQLPNDTLSFRDGRSFRSTRAAEIVASYAFDQSAPSNVRVDAIQIASSLHLTTLVPGLLSVALDAADDSRVRTWAVMVLNDIGSEQDKEQLISLVSMTGDEDVARVAVHCLWPDHLTTAAVLAFAERDLSRHSLDYAFEKQDLVLLPDTDLLHLLRFVLRHLDTNRRVLGFLDENFADRIVAEGLARIHHPPVLELIARIFRQEGHRARTLFAPDSETGLKLNDQSTRLAVLERIGRLELKRKEAGSYRNPFSVKREEDAVALLHLAQQQDDDRAFEVFANAGMNYHIWGDMALWSQALDLSTTDPRWRRHFPWLFANDIGGREFLAWQDQQRYERVKQPRIRKASKRKLRGLFDGHLATLETAVNRLPAILWNLKFDWNGPERQHAPCVPWRTRPGLAELTEEQQRTLDEASILFARRHLDVLPDELGVRQAVYVVLEDLALSNPEQLASLTAGHEENAGAVWAESVDCFSRMVAGKEYFSSFAGFILRYCQSAACAGVAAKLQARTADEVKSLTYVVDDVWTEPLQDVFFAWFSSQAPSLARLAVLENLVRHGHPAACHWCLDYLEGTTPEGGWPLWKEVAKVALNGCTAASWLVLWPLMKEREEVALELLRSTNGRREGTVVAALNDDQLADLWAWLQGRYTVPQPNRDGGIQPDTLDDICNGIVNKLSAAGTESAVVALRQMAEGYEQGHWIWSSHARGNRAWRAQRFAAWEPADLWRFARRGRRRTVRDAQELLADVVAELANFEPWLQSNRRVDLLWDQGQVLSAKPEPRASTVIRDYLESRLRGHFAVQEAEVGKGKTDIWVLAQASAAPSGQATVVIEVKWSHHGAADTAMETQLCKKYLSATASAAGLYLVLWSDGGQPYKQRSKQRWQSEAICKEELAKQAEKLTTSSRFVQSLVVNAGLHPSSSRAAVTMLSKGESESETRSSSETVQEAPRI